MHIEAFQSYIIFILVTLEAIANKYTDPHMDPVPCMKYNIKLIGPKSPL